jgi:hypothetical protein
MSEKLTSNEARLLEASPPIGAASGAWATCSSTMVTHLREKQFVDIRIYLNLIFWSPKNFKPLHKRVGFTPPSLKGGWR